MQFDSENKNSKWYDAITVEMKSMREYKVFKRWDKAILDKHKKAMNSPKGYHRIKVHLVFAVKFDGRHKARLVADGHLTPEPIENIYSGVVSLRNLRLVTEFGSVQGKEEIPSNMPELRGLGFIMCAKVDADHASDTMTRCSRTGFLVYLNCAPIY